MGFGGMWEFYLRLIEKRNVIEFWSWFLQLKIPVMFREGFSAPGNSLIELDKTEKMHYNSRILIKLLTKEKYFCWKPNFILNINTLKVTALYPAIKTCVITKTNYTKSSFPSSVQNIWRSHNFNTKSENEEDFLDVTL